MKNQFEILIESRSSKMTGAFSFSVIYFIGILFFADLLHAAPHRSKSKHRDAGPQLVYDQKQTGDYNIQLHLKDFQIIALLGDDSLGEYDYNYDYADFTIKPPASPKPTSASTTTTPPPISSTSELNSIPVEINNKPAEINNKPAEINNKPSEIPINSNYNNSSSTPATNLHPYPIELVVYDPSKKPIEESEKTSEKPFSTSEATSPLNNEITSSSSTSPSTTSESISSTSTTELITPGKIKVQILDSPVPTVDAPAGPVGIVPGEDVQSEINAGILQGELASYRKCASGFARDKKGRCRRVRRPGVTSQLPFGFSRIASNLATRLRLPTGDKSEASNTNLTEN